MAKLRFEPCSVDDLIDLLRGIGTFLHHVPERFSYERDPSDAHYINLAIASGSNSIISRDNDLLDLMSSLAPEAAAFRNNYPELRILNPVAFLRDLEADAL